MDSHKQVNGKGKKILEDAGIKVISGVLEEECKELNKRFFTFHEKKRPYILLKWAESADGFLDKDFQSTSISNALSQQMVHQLRADEHAILVGTKTALTDNPSLTVRKVSGKNPIRILIDFDLKVPENHNIFNDEARTLIFNTKQETEIGRLKWIKISRENFLENLTQKLYENEIQSVIVEGGRHTLQQFIDANFWDEAIVLKNNNLFLENGTKSPKLNAKSLKKEMLRDDAWEFYNFKSSSHL